MPKRVKKSSNPFSGLWRIVEMEQWDREFIDLEGPGYIRFSRGGNGEFHFGAVHGELDCRVEQLRGESRVEFSWLGNDEMEPRIRPRLGRLEGRRASRSSILSSWRRFVVSGNSIAI
jgi:hypothetical protein